MFNNNISVLSVELFFFNIYDLIVSANLVQTERSTKKACLFLLPRCRLNSFSLNKCSKKMDDFKY